MTKQPAPQPIDLLKTYPVYVPEYYEKLEIAKEVMPEHEFNEFFHSEAGVRASNLDFFFLHVILFCLSVRGRSSRHLFSE